VHAGVRFTQTTSVKNSAASCIAWYARIGRIEHDGPPCNTSALAIMQIDQHSTLDVATSSCARTSTPASRSPDWSVSAKPCGTVASETKLVYGRQPHLHSTFPLRFKVFLGHRSPAGTLSPTHWVSAQEARPNMGNPAPGWHLLRPGFEVG